MRYLPHTEQEIAEMLRVIGKGSLDELFSTIPEAVRFEGQLAVPPAVDEPSLMRHLSEIAAKNTGAQMCVTLSVACPTPQGLRVLCTDIDWIS